MPTIERCEVNAVMLTRCLGRRLWRLLMFFCGFVLACGQDDTETRDESMRTALSAPQSPAVPGDSAESWYARALQHVRSAEPEQALAAARRALQHDPCHLPSLLLTVELQAAEGRFAENSEFLVRTREMGCEHPALLFELGRACLALDRPEEALAAFQAVVELDPGHIRALNNIASLHARLSDVGKAIAVLEEVRQLDPGYVPAHYNVGMAHAQNGDYPQAVEALREAVRLDSLHLGSLVALGSVYNDLGRHADALPLLQRAVAVDSTSAAAHYQLAVAYIGENRPDAAIEQLQQAVHLDPTSVDAFYRLGQLLMRAGRSEEGLLALQQFERWRQLGRENPALWKEIVYHKQALAMGSTNDLAHFRLAELYAQQGWTAEAVRHYRCTLQAQPRHLPALRRLGGLYLQEKQLEEAAAVYERIVGEWPQEVSAWNNLCIAYTAAGRLEAAEDTFERALHLHPHEPYLYVNLGALYIKRQQPERAREAYARALSLAPGDERLRQAVERLSRR